jgi:hypothetical protein
MLVLSKKMKKLFIVYLHDLTGSAAVVGLLACRAHELGVLSAVSTVIRRRAQLHAGQNRNQWKNS